MNEKERLEMAFQWTGVGNIQLFKVGLDFRASMTYAPIDTVLEEVGDPRAAILRKWISHGWLYDSRC